ncbi:hypothetical protein BCT30_16270 [Enterovibrio norvegicus]|uniref:Uncharacterized protein n=1 Tax=Enterovibrio norvegicus DSM 15893 TaxID=1121869 RepID=A0A1I5RB31_9GAMM|nr:hypothetical protein [Enterovibrio norvegicus]MCC4798917.1 hypothetical protein [Enterovibrio norvegicus]OEE43314.1 hypothetical protein A1OS_11265 [Enterovibrio norvegicus]PMI37536.1 hypothetical protein BCU46_10755 [Enterovibrio norvegicus]PMN50665.1 hypothetical protein BCT30_16270 [Enterovibrio norvegicus]SFP55541.1 hypothetical protein SAMN03084138_02502 [Enterovibrio norvegicus DSM 15893]
MTGRFELTESTMSHAVNFDYTHFLSESSREHWTFTQALHAQISRWRRKTIEEYDDFPSEAFLHSVSGTLSAHYSDVSNLIRLIDEAKKQHITALNIMLPYALDDSELDKIRRRTRCDIVQHKGETEWLCVAMKTKNAT